ncbi:MAG: polyketide synthase, partial [Microcystaceae cyanobacterium]
MHQLQQRWNLPWQIKAGLAQGNLSLSDEQIAQLEILAKDSMHNPAQATEYVGYIGNIMPSRISALWDFTGPSFTLSAGENSTFKALETAQMLLSTGEVEAVLVGAVDLAGGFENVLWRNQLAKTNTGTNTLSYDQNANGWLVGEGAGAVVLKRLDAAQQRQDRIYAVVDAISLVQDCPDAETVSNFPHSPRPQTVAQACQQAFQLAGIKSTDIGYLEVFGSGIPQQDGSEMEGLLQAYQMGEPALISCAIASVKANIGHTYVASGIASLIKTALCLYHRYIPAVPQWSSPKLPERWQGSPFYVASDSKPWFLEQGTTTRIAAINGMGLDGTCAHLIVSEEASQQERSSRYLEQTTFYLLAVAADDRSTLLEELQTLQHAIEDSTSLFATASQTFATLQKRSGATYALA